ncbi:MAG: Hpt domain-containing protein, partial [Desulfamplus sp.]|nr:Hpt domain-containing protein [Desulfamplus sp.]
VEGIDHETAIKRLNNKPAMLVNILNDFKKNYAQEPGNIRTLFKEGNLNDIKTKAHTIKGIAGYMGADALFKSAADLEDFLRVNNTVEKEAFAAQHQFSEPGMLIESLAKNIEQIIASLDSLPPDLSEKKIEHQKPDAHQKLHEYKTTDQDQAIDEEKNRGGDKNRVSDCHLLGEFISLLHSGEARASEMLPEIEAILQAYGYSSELSSIAEFIDDIEYEQAGNMIEKILAQMK